MSLDGIHPPSCRINSEYQQQPINPRKCVECGKTHDTIVEDTMTGERLEEIQKCRDCIFKKCFFEWGRTARYMTSEEIKVKVAEELNRLENELLE